MWHSGIKAAYTVVFLLLIIFGLIVLPSNCMKKIRTNNTSQRITNSIPQQSASPTHTGPGTLTQIPTPQGGSKRDVTGHSAASGGTTSAQSGTCGD
jgi:hypothetical protein